MKRKIGCIALILGTILCGCASAGARTGYGFAPAASGTQQAASKPQSELISLDELKESGEPIPKKRTPSPGLAPLPDDPAEPGLTSRAEDPEGAPEETEPAESAESGSFEDGSLEGGTSESSSSENGSLEGGTSESSTSESSSLEGGSSAAEDSSQVLEIGEKMFLSQINDIYFNFDDYKDKTIVVEGMYSLLTSWDGGETCPSVYRRGPGCCGNDGWGGFLLRYDGELPQENDWIRVVGTPKLEQDGFFSNLYLEVSSIELKTERGAEFVLQ